MGWIGHMQSSFSSVIASYALIFFIMGLISVFIAAYNNHINPMDGKPLFYATTLAAFFLWWLYLPMWVVYVVMVVLFYPLWIIAKIGEGYKTAEFKPSEWTPTYYWNN
jgi:small-conductance mechanosensitive channel